MLKVDTLVHYGPGNYSPKRLARRWADSSCDVSQLVPFLVIVVVVVVVVIRYATFIDMLQPKSWIVDVNWCLCSGTLVG